MNEIVVISGKGGTGKTSLVASFAALSEDCIVADCDVDAADLHLILDPVPTKQTDFSGGNRAAVDPAACTACGVCKEYCQFDAITMDGPANDAVEKTARIDPTACEGCGVCNWFCIGGAVKFAPAINGKWFVSQTRFGPLVHAKLGIAEGNSGKLVHILRTEARALAEAGRVETILIDGSPGIGCPVIASITGANLVLIVTEPTQSGMHDFKRVAELAKHFKIPAMVCVNKWDLNAVITDRIELFAQNHGIEVAPRVRYDRAITDAQIAQQTVIEYQEASCAGEIREVWEKIQATIASPIKDN
ncbi:MAG: 4Fe-4S binding protein [Phycisphaerales bacterium]|jgi:MinD superfamily P-loop ATPase|nr:4Fe-4S binding protein [Phycisphaerales bacterium]MBT7172009.1 4Fe-4S binding protein [Phycisphaerales bacterium]